MHLSWFRVKLSNIESCYSRRFSPCFLFKKSLRFLMTWPETIKYYILIGNIAWFFPSMIRLAVSIRALNELVKRNEWDAKKVKLLKSFITKSTHKNGTLHEVKSCALEIDPTTRDKIGDNAGRVCCNYRTIKIKDSFRVKQCNKCLKFGHLAADCQTVKDCEHKVCRYCTQQHDTTESCEHRTNPICINCPMGQDNHHCSTVECPQDKQGMEQSISRIDYNYIMVYQWWKLNSLKLFISIYTILYNNFAGTMQILNDRKNADNRKYICIFMLNEFNASAMTSK